MRGRGPMDTAAAHNRHATAADHRLQTCLSAATEPAPGPGAGTRARSARTPRAKPSKSDRQRDPGGDISSHTPSTGPVTGDGTHRTHRPAPPPNVAYGRPAVPALPVLGFRFSLISPATGGPGRHDLPGPPGLSLSARPAAARRRRPVPSMNPGGGRSRRKRRTEGRTGRAGHMEAKTSCALPASVW